MNRRLRPRHPLAPALLLVLLGGCGILGPDDDLEYREARDRWERVRPASYSWTVDRHCFCGAFGEAEIRVVDGEKVSVVRVGPGEPVGEDDARWFPTVDELFEVVERARREAAWIRTEFDPRTGAPLRVDIDWIADAVDDEILYTATVPVPIE